MKFTAASYGENLMVRDRKAAEQKGRVAETIALALMLAKGYRLLKCRYKSRYGEIDLIMRKGDTTVFIEVKARASHDEAIISISDTQARRISNAATQFMSEDEIAAQGFCRFDIVAVNSKLMPKHIENAFEGSF